MIVVKALLLICCLRLSFGRQYTNYKKFEIWDASKVIPNKLIEAMAQYNEEARHRLQEMNEMRFMYEESPHYEEGYLMSEIVERYRKMVNQMKRPVEFQSDAVFKAMKTTEIVQNLWMEIYHLVHMMHEIPRKYRHIPEFADLDKEVDVAKVAEEEKRQREQDRLQKRDNKKQQKVYKKMRELMKVQGQVLNYPPKEKNKWWPIDYGWEIDYYW